MTGHNDRIIGGVTETCAEHADASEFAGDDGVQAHHRCRRDFHNL
jgi:hypothetical protein